MLLWFVLAACSDKSTDDSDVGTDDSDSGEQEEITYPKGDRILLYYGNSGFQPDIAGNGAFDEIADEWKDTYGWNTDHYNYWPEDLSVYRMVGLVAPGWLEVQTPFTGEDATRLQAALDVGTRIVIIGEQPMCSQGADTVNGLLGKLGVSWRLTGKGGDEASVVETTAVTENHQITDGVQSLRLIDPCWATENNATVLAADTNNNVIAVAERTGKAGDVVFLGDVTMLDDSDHSGGHGYEMADNLTLLKNLVRITPE